VDDNATQRRLLEHQLAAWGLVPSSAATGPAALAHLRDAGQATPFALAILDHQMPAMDGLTLARAIQADPHIARPPLVLLTSLGQGDPAAAAQAAGIAATLTKPVRQSRLYDCLVTLLAPAAGAGGPAPGLTPGLTPRPAPGPAPGPATGGPGAGPAARGPRLLLAEDNAINQKVARHLLEKLGYQADVVANGREAVAALARHPYPLVLMDCQMPELDGYAATAAIRAREGATQHTPIVAITAGAMASERERCFAAGMDDYIAKPVRLEDLATVLARWLPAAAAQHPLAPAPAPAPAPARGAGVDPSVLAKLGDPALGGDPAFLRELVAIFHQESPPLLAALRTAAAHGDAAGLLRPAHTLRGNAGYFGATRLSALCEQLEALGRAQPPAEGAAFAALVDAVAQELAAVHHVLAEHAQQWSA
jgi:CheY-like chemotaxis protein/HPt (histidine-containing phosphotransfer) domain-containing protein